MTCPHPPKTVICGPLYPEGECLPYDGRPQNIREQDEHRAQWCTVCGALRWHPEQEWILPDAQKTAEPAEPSTNTIHEAVDSDEDARQRVMALLLDESGDGDDMERRDLDAADIADAHGFGPLDHESAAEWADRLRSQEGGES